MVSVPAPAQQGRRPALQRRRVAIVGAGPAGLFAAEHIASAGHAVTIYERMPSPARKLLMAGRGGLNLTHSEPFEQLLSRYGAAAPRLEAALRSFPPAALQEWAQGLGQETFVGTSGRVFPRAMKSAPLLRAWLRRLGDLGVSLRPRHRWTGWDAAGRLLFEAGPAGDIEVETADATLLALGGASWPRLGANGDWVVPLAAAGVAVTPLEPANCGVRIAWSESFRARCEGQPLKRIAVRVGAIEARGEAVVTSGGLEGGVIYVLTPSLRALLASAANPHIVIDLRPDITEAGLAQRLSRPRGKQSTANFLRKSAALSPVAIALLREAAGGALPATPASLASLIKAVTLPATGLAGLNRAISTAGGVALDDIDEGYMLRRCPGVFVAGEMLDWEAPTGGYLLQATFATAAAAAQGLLRWLDGDRPLRDRVATAGVLDAPSSGL
jgi:uncharacterized flavoprotein (TIGR03862 family)